MMMERHIGTCFLIAAINFSGSAIADTDNDQNAAVSYRDAIYRGDRFADAYWEAIWDYQYDPYQPPTPKVRAALAKATIILRRLDKGSKKEWSDFDIDRGRFAGSGLPHLGSLRSILHLVQVDAYVRLHDGDSYGAAKRIAMMYRISEHFSCDRTRTSSLVGAATFSMADAVVQSGMDRAAFADKESRVMLRALDRLTSPDSMGFVEGMATGQEASIEWLSTHWDEPDDREEMIARLTTDPDQISSLASMTGEDLSASVEQYDHMMDKVIEAFLSDDRKAGRAQVAQIQRELEAGEHGLLARLVTAPLLSVFDSMEKHRAQVEERQTILRRIIAGEVQPEAEANAAFYYAQGIDRLRQIDQEHLATLRALEFGREIELKSKVLETLATAAPVVDLFREGASMKRCDFDFLRPGVKWRQLCPDYVSGMRDALCLLHADALRLLRAGKVDAAVDRFSISYRIVGHLSNDEPILCAILAQETINRLGETVGRARERGTLSAKHCKQLLDSAERVSSRDPFGYIGSLITTRKAIALKWGTDLQGSSGEEGNQRVLERINHLTGEQLLYVLAVYDAVARSRELVSQDPLTDQRDAAQELGDIIDFSKLQLVRASALVLEPVLSQRTFSVIDYPELSCFAQVSERMRRARTDLRNALALLRE